MAGEWPSLGLLVVPKQASRDFAGGQRFHRYAMQAARRQHVSSLPFGIKPERSSRNRLLAVGRLCEAA